MKKYINLLIKDLIVCRNIFIFFAMFVTYMNLLTFLFFPIDKFISFMNISLLETSIFFVLYKLEVQKNHGEEFILTTSYTRKNLVLSRYIMAFLCTIFEFVTYFCGKFLIYHDARSVSSILNQLFLSFIIIVILLPLSFKKNIKWLSIGSAAIFYAVWNFENVFAFLYSPLFIFISIFATFSLSLLSLKLSTEIFLSQDF